MIRKYVLSILLCIATMVVVWCSTSLDNPLSEPQDDSSNQVWSDSNIPSSDSLAWLTDTEKQFMQYYSDEWKKRLQNIWQWRSATETWHERADKISDYLVYTSLTPYSNDVQRLKVLVAVYTNEWLPVQSLTDLASSGKRWNIIVDGTQHVPYMDAWFFFESEFKDNWNEEVTIEFSVNWDTVKESILLP